jgi:hypothetical protein
MAITSLIDDCIRSAIDYGIAAYEDVENSRKTNRLYDKRRKKFKLLKTLWDKDIACGQGAANIIVFQAPVENNPEYNTTRYYQYENDRWKLIKETSLM